MAQQQQLTPEYIQQCVEDQVLPFCNGIISISALQNFHIQGPEECPWAQFHPRILRATNTRYPLCMQEYPCGSAVCALLWYSIHYNIPTQA